MSDYGLQAMKERDEARAEGERLRARNAELTAALRDIVSEGYSRETAWAIDIARAALAKAEGR